MKSCKIVDPQTERLIPRILLVDKRGELFRNSLIPCPYIIIPFLFSFFKKK